MDVTAEFIGVWLDADTPRLITFSLSPKAGLSDLMAELNRRFGRTFPDKLWDRENNKFKQPVLIMRNNQEIGSSSPVLHEGDQVSFIFLPSGG